jgi:hypothetical protein
MNLLILGAVEISSTIREKLIQTLSTESVSTLGQNSGDEIGSIGVLPLT